jgi:uncharacterized lipoprotein YddW (UPF0748 family)
MVYFNVKTVTPNDTDETSTTETTTQSEEVTTEDISDFIPQVDNPYTALNFDTPKAMWFSYMDYSTVLYDQSEEEFTANMAERFDNAKDMGINTVYVHVRSHANSYYISELFPKAGYYNSDYDPLEIMVNLAHERGLSIHAWINPMRCMTTENMDSMSDEYTVKQWYNSEQGTYINEYNGYWYLNPYYEEVRQLICDGVREIMEGYQVDGIHIDDYFYPTTDESFDSISFAESGESDLLQFRRDNVNTLVKEMYSTIKSINSSVEFGISPQGNISVNLNEQCADVELWTSTEGYCDYIVPQIYFGFNNSTCPYLETLNRWAELNENSSVKLVIGLGVYKVGKVDTWAGDGSDEWVTDDVIGSQIDYAFANPEVEGVALFDYGSIFEPDDDSVTSKMLEEVQNIKERLE